MLLCAMERLLALFCIIIWSDEVQSGTFLTLVFGNVVQISCRFITVMQESSEVKPAYIIEYEHTPNVLFKDGKPQIISATVLAALIIYIMVLVTLGYGIGLTTDCPLQKLLNFSTLCATIYLYHARSTHLDSVPRSTSYLHSLDIYLRSKKIESTKVNYYVDMLNYVASTDFRHAFPRHIYCASRYSLYFFVAISVLYHSIIAKFPDPMWVLRLLLQGVMIVPMYELNNNNYYNYHDPVVSGTRGIPSHEFLKARHPNYACGLSGIDNKGISHYPLTPSLLSKIPQVSAEAAPTQRYIQICENLYHGTVDGPTHLNELPKDTLLAGPLSGFTMNVVRGHAHEFSKPVQYANSHTTTAE
ncbi:hypothetical protein E3Q22_04443 [Wallemia mellicola]|uniref:Uncharacterized protein n=1 Tax=Wallemia mellicola TaxID=1708541 RepID=A0A4V4MEF4_9BASI|nr:hypothetical protein E3Q22_04443 [Wallemia mellicola]